MTDKRQYLVYSLLALAVLIMTAILMPASRHYFNRFYGSPNPLVVLIVGTVVGGGALRLLGRLGGFQIFRGQDTLRGIRHSLLLVVPLAVAVTLADIFIGYPENTNVPVPPALLFYPAIGFIVEIAFHLVPLAVLLLALHPLRNRIGTNRILWFCLVFTATAEPVFQVAFGGSGGSAISVYTGVHVFAIALLQLYVFWRYDFVTMYAFRLIYYAYWHILWGVIRLEVLF